MKNNISTVIICLIIAAVCINAVRSYVKKLKNGCCGGGDSEIKIKPADKNTANYAYKAKVFIDGMTCNHCKTRVENAFNQTDGFLAKVNLKKNYAELFSKSEPNLSEIKKIVERSGYTFIKLEK